MLAIRQLKSIDSLFDMLDQCDGAIFITGSDGAKMDIRGNALIRELLASACREHGIESLQLDVENDQDIPKIIDYLIGCKRPAGARQPFINWR